MKRSWEVATVALCASLYAVVGYASYLGILTPVIGVVRFWPSVFIPAIFAVLFGPKVGGLGGAIGIFISDMVIHGNALLSLTVGVPANFACFYTVGWLAKSIKKDSKLWIVLAIVEEGTLALLVYVVMRAGLLSPTVAMAYMIGIGSAALFTILYGFVWSRKPALMFAYNTGLLIGAIIIGIGVYAFSQLFILPGGLQRLSVEAILLWAIWTYSTEIPFMVGIATPVIVIGEKVIPKVNKK
ncbi:MAG: hypothetical protein B6U94_00095 [Thermofilum sp. ex4484_79]|nr:MAG: hypothetical protein B6U94_00095 [Thermofilum sp. ex4484_79]